MQMYIIGWIVHSHIHYKMCHQLPQLKPINY